MDVVEYRVNVLINSEIPFCQTFALVNKRDLVQILGMILKTKRYDMFSYVEKY